MEWLRVKGWGFEDRWRLKIVELGVLRDLKKGIEVKLRILMGLEKWVGLGLGFRFIDFFRFHFCILYL